MHIIDDAFALHITWTTYGSRLPGDERGHVSNTLVPGEGYRPKENTPGTPVAAGDAITQQRARELQKWPTVYLTQSEALTAARALVEAARRRGWRIVRAAIMTDHAHVVIMDCPDDGSQVRRVLKGASQAFLSEKRGSPRTWWTTGGSDRYKHGTLAIETAIQYVADQENKLAEIVDMEARACT
jgi:REP element-mobilizing transposase RayT